MKTRRNTMQKMVILDVLKKFDDHPTVDEIYTEVKNSHPSISKNTVYRNLRLLADDGKIRKVSLPSEQERYEGLTKHHYHFQCKVCCLIADVDIDYLESINEDVRQKYGYQIDGHEIVFRGVCLECISKNKLEYLGGC